MEPSLDRCASSQASLCQKGSEPRLRREFFFFCGGSWACPALLCWSSAAGSVETLGSYESETEKVSKRDSSEVLAVGLDTMPILHAYVRRPRARPGESAAEPRNIRLPRSLKAPMTQLVAWMPMRMRVMLLCAVAHPAWVTASNNGSEQLSPDGPQVGVNDAVSPCGHGG